MAFPKRYSGFRKLENTPSTSKDESGIFGTHYAKALNFKNLFTKSLRSKSSKKRYKEKEDNYFMLKKR